jgi:hypothetical protein
VNRGNTNVFHAAGFFEFGHREFRGWLLQFIKQLLLEPANESH